EPQSETVWHQADKFHVPRLAFVNKMDRLGADFAAVVGQIRTRLGAKPVPIQLPLGAESEFEGAIDLLEMKAVRFTGNEEDAPQASAAPDDAGAAEARQAMIESVAEEDDALMERYLGGEALDGDTLRAAIRRATIAGKIVPVLCGAALRNMGVQPLLDAV